MERAHGELRAGLADRLRGDDADCQTELDQAADDERVDQGVPGEPRCVLDDDGAHVALAEEREAIGATRQRGQLVASYAAAEAVLYNALSRGLSFKLSMGNVLTLTPPLIITRDEMDAALDIIETCLAETHAAG